MTSLQIIGVGATAGLALLPVLAALVWAAIQDGRADLLAAAESLVIGEPVAGEDAS